MSDQAYNVADPDAGTAILTRMEEKTTEVAENWEDELGRDCVAWLQQAREELRRIEMDRLRCVSAAMQILEICRRLEDEAGNDESQKILTPGKSR